MPTEVEFGDGGLYQGRNGMGELCGVSVHASPKAWGGRTRVYAINSRGLTEACYMAIPPNYADLVAVAILREFVVNAAAWVGLVPETPPYLVIDKLIESENEDHKLLGEMMRLAFMYNQPPDVVSDSTTITRAAAPNPDP